MREEILNICQIIETGNTKLAIDLSIKQSISLLKLNETITNMIAGYKAIVDGLKSFKARRKHIEDKIKAYDTFCDMLLIELTK